LERRKLTAEALSGRQLAVASVVSGLSAGAAAAGRVDWLWLLLWCAAAAGAIWLAQWRLKGRSLRRSPLLRLLYPLWGSLLAAQALGRTTARIELTSGGSGPVWLLLLLLIPLLWIAWGKPAPFFRMAEILWLAMAVTLALVLAFGLARMEWRYAVPKTAGAAAAAPAAMEILSPALFALPYIYNNVEEGERCGFGWLGGLSLLCGGMCLVTTGFLGDAARGVSQPFFAAAGLLGKSARCEGLLSVLWLLPDLTLVSLLCRPWGDRRWPAAGVLLAAGLSLAGVADGIPREFFSAGSALLFLLTLCFPGKREKIVV